MEESTQLSKQLNSSTVESKEQQAKTNKQLASLEEKRAKQIQGIVKNGIDLIIPSARLGWIPVSDGTVGLAGAITSIIGMIDTCNFIIILSCDGMQKSMNPLLTARIVFIFGTFSLFAGPGNK
jgi:hypothetical protein